MVIDTHTHYGLFFEERDGLDPGRWFEFLDAAGVDGAILMTLRGLLPGSDPRRCNEDVARVVDRVPDRLVGFGTVNPFSGPPSVSEAHHCLHRLGLRGIKWHPWVQGFWNVGSAEVHEICRVCAEAGAPLVFHDGTPNVSMPSQVAKLAQKHPETTFILGHGGLMHLWRQAAEAAALYENIYITLCGPHPVALAHICRTVPVDRILWGSDHGLGPTDMVRYRKELVLRLDLDDARKQAILGTNAARLLGWRPTR